MDEGALLTLEEAATRSGYRKRELRALVREGRLPAVRAGKRWQVATSDLALLPSRLAAPAEPPPLPAAQAAAVEAPADPRSDPVIALIGLLRERDQKLTELLEERSQLTGQVGFLLGQLSEREERIQRLEQAMLADSAGRSVNVLSAPPGPIALIDEWTTQLPPDPTASLVESTADLRDDQKSILTETSPAGDIQIERNDSTPIVDPDRIASPAPVTTEPPAAPPGPAPRPRGGLFRLFRRRAPG